MDRPEPPPKTPHVYYSFHEYLPRHTAEHFFTDYSHAEQIVLVEQYLDFLSTKDLPNTSSSKQSICELLCTDEATHLVLAQAQVKFKTLSGFGVQGTPTMYGHQRQLVHQVANYCDKISYQYHVEQGSSSSKKKQQLNSRSFYFYWCHAEKQMLVQLLSEFARCTSVDFWQHLELRVDRPMCPDCRKFFEAVNEAEPNLNMTFIHSTVGSHIRFH